jgi:ketosteroid isomerase-like protein
MKNHFVIAAVVFAFATSAFSQTNSDKDKKTEQQIIKIMDDWAVVSGRRDVAATSKLLPEDFTITDCDGSVQTKAQYLNVLKNLPGNIVIKDTEQKARVFSDTAVITAHYTVEAETQKQLLGAFRYMTVFQKQGGRWMPIAFQRVCQAKQ